MNAANTHTALAAFTAVLFTSRHARRFVVLPAAVVERSASREKIEKAVPDARGTANTANVGANAREQHVSAKKMEAPTLNRREAFLMAALVLSMPCFFASDASLGL